MNIVRLGWLEEQSSVALGSLVKMGIPSLEMLKCFFSLRPAAVVGPTTQSSS